MRKKESECRKPDAFVRVLMSIFPGVRVEREFIFHPVRLWRFDYALPEYKLAIEIDGAIWTGGRHVHPSGYLGDLEKFNEAAALGWRVLRFAQGHQFTTVTLSTIERAVHWIEENEK